MIERLDQNNQFNKEQILLKTFLSFLLVFTFESFQRKFEFIYWGSTATFCC